MEQLTKYFYKTSLGLSAIIVLTAFLITFPQAHASNFTFTKTKIQIENNAGVYNTTDTGANTGSNTTNTTDGNSTSIVQTGNAGSNTTICNQVNTNNINSNGNQNCVTPTPQVTPAPTNVPPTGTPGCTGNCGNSGGGSSGSSNNSTSSNNSGSSSSPQQGVLGANTMASTGTFDTSIMNILFTLGTLTLGAGFFSFRKEKRT